MDLECCGGGTSLLLSFHLLLVSELLGLKEHCQVIFMGADSNTQELDASTGSLKILVIPNSVSLVELK